RSWARSMNVCGASSSVASSPGCPRTRSRKRSASPAAPCAGTGSRRAPGYTASCTQNPAVEWSSMPAERFRRVSALFDEALDQPEDQRTIWLARACGGDAELEAEVRRMLDAHARAGILDLSIGGLASRALDEVQAVHSGTIGPYRILREVGRG